MSQVRLAKYLLLRPGFFFFLFSFFFFFFSGVCSKRPLELRLPFLRPSLDPPQDAELDEVGSSSLHVASNAAFLLALSLPSLTCVLICRA